MREPLDPARLAALSVLKRALLLHRSCLLRRAELGNEERRGAGEPQAVYIGEGETLPYLALLHGGAGPRRTVPLTGLRRELRRETRRCLLYLELNRLLTPKIPGAFRTTPWVRQRIDLGGDRFRAHHAEIEGVFGRKVRHFGLTSRTTRDRDAVDAFHDEYYVPYVSARHPANLHLRRRDELHHAVRHGFLLQVVEGGEWVAGAVCRRHRCGLTVVAYGLRGEEHRGRQRGWLSAATYFAIAMAREEDLAWVDLLRSRPHLADGVFEHKRRFGATAFADPWPHTALWVLPATAAPLPSPAEGLLVESPGGFVPLAEAAAFPRSGS